jgi:hypothetical protein
MMRIELSSLLRCEMVSNVVRFFIFSALRAGLPHGPYEPAGRRGAGSGPAASLAHQRKQMLPPGRN